MTLPFDAINKRGTANKSLALLIFGEFYGAILLSLDYEGVAKGMISDLALFIGGLKVVLIL